MTRHRLVVIAIGVVLVAAIAAVVTVLRKPVATIEAYPVLPPAELVPEPTDPFEEHRRYQEDVLRQLDAIEQEALELQRAVREMGERQAEEDEILLRIEERMDELERRR